MSGHISEFAPLGVTRLLLN